MKETNKSLQKSIQYLINPLKLLRGKRSRSSFYRTLHIDPKIYAYYEDNIRAIPKSLVDNVILSRLVEPSDANKFTQDVLNHNRRLRDLQKKFSEFTPIDNICTHLEYVSFKNGCDEKVSHDKLGKLIGFGKTTLWNIQVGRSRISKNVESKLIELADKTGYQGNIKNEINIFNSF